MNRADYLEIQLDLFDNYECPLGGDNQDSSSGKTYQVHLQADQSVVLTLEPCLKASQKPIFQCLKMEDGRQPEWFNAQSVKLHGEHLTLNFGEYPNEERESSLSQILQQPTDVPEKYYLSSRACQGILNRAEKRGKELPAPLKKALEQQANLSTGGGTSVVKIRSGRDDGTAGKGALIGIEQSFTLGTGNDQTLFQEKLTSTVGGAEVLDNEQGEFYDKLYRGQSTDSCGNGLERRTCTCNGKQTVGSLCAHDGRGFNGQDVANDKLIVETMNESI